MHCLRRWFLLWAERVEEMEDYHQAQPQYSVLREVLRKVLWTVVL